MIAEPDVALTDYALFVESVLFCFWIYARNRSHPLTRWFLLLFGSIALASAFGGTVHGFLTNPQSPVSRAFWYATMILLGLTALSEFGIAARMSFAARAAKFVVVAALAIFGLYVATVLFWNAEFRLAILDYLVGLVFLSVAFVYAYAHTREASIALGVLGLVLTVVASVLQQARVSPHPRYFNHNALYHLLQAIALFFIYRAARHLVTMLPPPAADDRKPPA